MTSGFPPEADIVTAGRHVSKVPNCDISKVGHRLPLRNKKPPEGGS
jgi:hypothetical protein